MTKNRIRIHIGAHKTGTTQIQNTLLNNVDYLSGIEVRYIGPEEFRKSFKPKDIKKYQSQKIKYKVKYISKISCAKKILNH